MIIYNVTNKIHDYVSSWEVEPLVYDKLTNDDIGRIVIYVDYGRAEFGILTSFRDGKVWARYHKGDTSAAAFPRDLCFGIKQL